MALSKDEIESIRQENHKTESNIGKSAVKKPNRKIILVSVISVLLILAGAGIGIGLVNANKPGPVDEFAKCLTEKGAVMYGATSCQYSHAQQGMFGNSKKHLDIRDFSKDKSVKITPTWKINGAYYQNVQTFDRLADLTGCDIN